jgi:hypothetical protein
VRIPEDLLTEERRVIADLRIRMQPAAGVVQVDDPLGVEAAVLLRTEIVQGARAGIRWMALEESRRHGHHAILSEKKKPRSTRFFLTVVETDPGCS